MQLGQQRYCCSEDRTRCGRMPRRTTSAARSVLTPARRPSAVAADSCTLRARTARSGGCAVLCSLFCSRSGSQKQSGFAAGGDVSLLKLQTLPALPLTAFCRSEHRAPSYTCCASTAAGGRAPTWAQGRAAGAPAARARPPGAARPPSARAPVAQSRGVEARLLNQWRCQTACQPAEPARLNILRHLGHAGYERHALLLVPLKRLQDQARPHGAQLLRAAQRAVARSEPC